MQIKASTAILALLGSSLAAPVTWTEGSVEVLSSRQIPPPDPDRCAELKEFCDCSRIPKEDIEGWFQCTTNFLCEWCAGLWSSHPEDPEESKAPELVREGTVGTRST